MRKLKRYMNGFKTVRFLFINTLLIGSLVMLMSSTDSERKIVWDANKKLTWADFKDTLITNSSRVALTSSGMDVKFAQTSENSLTITAICEMIPSGSWVDSTKKSDYMLSHEQYHFNITEYWCRKLKKDLSTEKFTTKNFKNKMTSLQKEAFEGCQNMQIQYDTESNHSQITEQQKKWEQKVDELLKSLDQYTEPTVTVTLR